MLNLPNTTLDLRSTDLVFHDTTGTFGDIKIDLRTINWTANILPTTVYDSKGNQGYMEDDPNNPGWTRYVLTPYGQNSVTFDRNNSQNPINDFKAAVGGLY